MIYRANTKEEQDRLVHILTNFDENANQKLAQSTADTENTK